MKFKNLIRSRFTFYKAHLAQKGQLAVLFSILTPIWLLIFGMVFDLGWYYLNVSRLQNAADSAAVAGAQTLIKADSFLNYKAVSLIKKASMKEENIHIPESYAAEVAIKVSNNKAANYVLDNLSHDKNWEFNGEAYIVKDAWSKSKVTMNPLIYEYNNNLYYVVRLREKIRHFFLSGWFEDMNAPVTAITMLKKEEPSSKTPPVPIDP